MRGQFGAAKPPQTDTGFSLPPPNWGRDGEGDFVFVVGKNPGNRDSYAMTRKTGRPVGLPATLAGNWPSSAAGTVSTSLVGIT